MKDSKQPVITLDHNVQDKSQKNLEKYFEIEQFAMKYNVDFYPSGTGIGHQVFYCVSYNNCDTQIFLNCKMFHHI
jgi:aconitase A